ncbi:hypothetical protein EYF80_043897 [Liparis tanakae]|uniref:Uncharacterized protein n=1 Tax=Liparis tanakae TaxID=230148 RepID=A0A4Z2FXD3_9TELE|nr:hypothetical protein EYF80_043897 [Liparis tanakae]
MERGRSGQRPGLSSSCVGAVFECKHYGCRIWTLLRCREDGSDKEEINCPVAGGTLCFKQSEAE